MAAAPPALVPGSEEDSIKAKKAHFDLGVFAFMLLKGGPPQTLKSASHRPQLTGGQGGGHLMWLP